jgi:hypothetical protein
MNIRYMGAKKAALRQQYTMVQGVGFVPVCPYCWEVKKRYTAPAHAHHFLVTRGDVQRWPEANRFLIDDARNLVVLCDTCHEIDPGPTQQMTEFCIAYKTRQGHDLQAFLNGLPFKVLGQEMENLVAQYHQSPEQVLATRNA